MYMCIYIYMYTYVHIHIIIYTCMCTLARKPEAISNDNNYQDKLSTAIAGSY